MDLPHMDEAVGDGPPGSGAVDHRDSERGIRACGVRVAVIANSSAGQAEDKAGMLLACVREHLESAGTDMVDTGGAEASVGDQLNRAKASPIDAVIAVGGDGTVNGAAEVALRYDAVLVVVPTGTLNLVAADLGIEPTSECITALLSEGRLARIDAGRVNGHLFLHSSHLGVVPNLTAHREALRKASDPASRLQSARDWIRGCLSSRQHRITCTDGSRSNTITTRAMAVTCNILTNAGALQYPRRSLNGGVLGLYASSHQGRLATLEALASMALGRLPDDSQTLRAKCPDFLLRTRARRLTLCNDGELVEVRTPCAYQVMPSSLRVLVPPSEQKATVP